MTPVEIGTAAREGISTTFEAEVYQRSFRVEFERALETRWGVAISATGDPRWRAPLQLYVIWCPYCNLYSVRHKHGYEGRLPCGRLMNDGERTWCRYATFPERLPEDFGPWERLLQRAAGYLVKLRQLFR